MNVSMEASYSMSASVTVTGVSTTVSGEKAAGAEKKEDAAVKQDAFTESKTGKNAMDVDTVKAMKEELEAVKLRFLDTVRSSIGKQVKFGQGAWAEVNIDDATRKEFQENVSEDGYWGVKQTSERIVSFAKALVGGDASRIEEMRDAFEKGYREVEKLWGDQMPDVSKRTYDAVMKLFDEWAGKTDETEETAEAAAVVVNAAE